MVIILHLLALDVYQKELNESVTHITSHELALVVVALSSTGCFFSLSSSLWPAKMLALIASPIYSSRHESIRK